MAGISSNLYPPVIDTYMPAFVKSSESEETHCRVYFSISAYNSFDDIQEKVQVTIRNQSTNRSALNKTIAPAGIMFKTLQRDEDITNDACYFIDITGADLAEDFIINQYYKVQIRFTNNKINSDGYPQAISGPPTATWLANPGNQGCFSEWSRVCLIRAISQPIVNVSGLEEKDINSPSIIDLGFAEFVGSLSFADPKETEFLKSYQIQLYNTSSKKLLQDSGVVQASDYNNINSIKYILSYNFESKISYYIAFTFTTNNLYTETHYYPFVFRKIKVDTLDQVNINVEPDNDAGCINIRLISSEVVKGNVVIRRSSIRDNYEYWEDIHTEYFANAQALNYTFVDYNVESGIYYKYAIQKRDYQGNRGALTVQKVAPMCVDFEDMFLVAEGVSLRFKYNQKVTSQQRVVQESKTDTIGSKYSYIRRNGALNYRQFSIGGLITSLNDAYEEPALIQGSTPLTINSVGRYSSTNKHIFTDADLQKYANSRTEYNKNNKVFNGNDFVYEREFRDRVMQFLYADNVKLFKTLTEGNVLVKLMNISLSPREQIGRLVWDFSATAYEIDDYNITNVNKYNIQQLGKYNETRLSTDLILNGQAFNGELASNEDVCTLVTNQLQENDTESITTMFHHIFNVQVAFNSEPYLINKEYEKVSSPDGPVSLGRVVYINGEPIIWKQDIMYLNDIEVTSLYFPYDTYENTPSIYYDISYTQQDETVEELVLAKYYETNGQLSWQKFTANTNIVDLINFKYLLIDESVSGINILDMRIEASYGTPYKITLRNIENPLEIIEKHWMIGRSQKEDSNIQGGFNATIAQQVAVDLRSNVYFLDGQLMQSPLLVDTDIHQFSDYEIIGLSFDNDTFAQIDYFGEAHEEIALVDDKAEAFRL